jgi:two-component system CheB/CheR fusion protein
VKKWRAHPQVMKRHLKETNEILQAQIAERKRAEETFEKVQRYTESIMEIIHEPLIVLTPGLRVITVNCSFYDRFHVTAEETEGRFVYSIGDHSLNIPAFFLLQGNGFFDKLVS